MSIVPPKFFDPGRATFVQHRNLPHWQQEGVCAFVTMRLFDSLPSAVMEKHAQARRRWLAERGCDPDLPEAFVLDQLSPMEQRSFRRFASSRLQRSLDKGAGSCLLRQSEIRSIVEECLRFGDGRDYALYGFVVMPNHVHLLLQPFADHSLQKVLSSMRRVSARNVNRLMRRTGDLWQSEPFDHLVRSAHWFERYRSYMRLNPVRARLPAHAYTWWQAEL
jgi:REP element-mobilizing transposase RayT